MLLRCTQKFLAELRTTKSEIAQLSGADHQFHEWYAHAFYLYPRRKCAIFMHARTKFCFFVYDRNRDQLANIKELFGKGLGRALFDERYSAPVIKLFNEHLGGIQIGLAQDRRVLGYMNEQIKEVKFMADYYPEDRRIYDESLAGLSARRSHMVKEKAAYAIEQMKEFLLGCSELQGVEISPAGSQHPELESFFEWLHAERNSGEP